MLRLLVLDNFDSFTWNLVHYLEELFPFQIDVFRNTEITVEAASEYDLIVLSPGPGIPEEAGILVPLIKTVQGRIPVLGVCLGHQAITIANTGSLIQLQEVMHGLQRKCIVKDPSSFLFKNISDPFEAGRYHSWVVDEGTLPTNFKILATDEQGFIMALHHEELMLTGVQFHPESVMTPSGKQILSNWLGYYLPNLVSLP